ncbi:hypothetical protein GJ496_004873 [Pomphorhynchus laevis]|nr:hypothetical protein GJ496_004873 [Pomphorhynchus laevis]
MSRSGRMRGPALFVRNISDRVRYDEIKKLFEKYGRVVDVTIPLDYYTRYEDPRDAEDAMYHLDRVRIHGRELEIEFARGERKTPADMRNRDRDGRFENHYRERRRSRSPLDRRTPSYDRYQGRRTRSPNRRSISRRYSRSGSLSEKDSRRSGSIPPSRCSSKTDSFRKEASLSRSPSLGRNGRRNDPYMRRSFENNRRREESFSPRL